MLFGIGNYDNFLNSETFKMIAEQLMENSEDLGEKLTLESAKRLALKIINREGLDMTIKVLFEGEND